MTYDEILTRARSAIGHGITYHLGHGGLHPADALPSRDGQCDCSGFVAWVLGRSRNPATARGPGPGSWRSSGGTTPPRPPSPASAPDSSSAMTRYPG